MPAMFKHTITIFSQKQLDAAELGEVLDANLEVSKVVDLGSQKVRNPETDDQFLGDEGNVIVDNHGAEPEGDDDDEEDSDDNFDDDDFDEEEEDDDFDDSEDDDTDEDDS